MDLDAFAAVHSAQWARLDALLGQRRLTAAETDELLDLYQRVSTHLSVVRSSSPDPSMVSYLSGLLARVRLRSGRGRPATWRDPLIFFAVTFPGALYAMRRWWLWVLAANVVFMVGSGAWFLYHPEIMSAMIPAEEADAYVNSDFANYYSEYASHEFATRVWVNNAWVSAQAIAFGILGLPTLYVLFSNALSLGVVGALMISHDRTALFFGMILPHGLLEMTAVFIAGGVGLRLFWSWVDPGPRPRAQSLAAAGRSSVAVVLGLVAVLGVSGLIEGFVTPSSLPTWARVGIGIVVEAAFLVYVFVVGRTAAATGATGDLEERDTGATLPVSA